MERNKQWMTIVLVVLTTLLFSACQQNAAPKSSEPPSSVEEIPGSDLKRVVLTEKAADRLGLQTDIIREESIVRGETVLGEVITQRGEMVANPNQVWVRVPFNEMDMKMVARDQPAMVLPLVIDDEEDIDEDENGTFAELDDILGEDDSEESALYYLVDNPKTTLLSGDKVFVKVSLSDDGEMRKVIPYAALIYDINGGTWVYTKELNDLAFIRQSVTVDYIMDDLVVLIEGPPEGTEIVTVGVEELYGAETGVSK